MPPSCRRVPRASYKRRQTRYRITEEQARERFGDDAQKVEGSLEVRTPNHGTNFLGPLKA